MLLQRDSFYRRQEPHLFTWHLDFKLQSNQTHTQFRIRNSRDSWYESTESRHWYATYAIYVYARTLVSLNFHLSLRRNRRRIEDIEQFRNWICGWHGLSVISRSPLHSIFLAHSFKQTIYFPLRKIGSFSYTFCRPYESNQILIIKKIQNPRVQKSESLKIRNDI